MAKSGSGKNLLRIELGRIPVFDYVSADDLLRRSPLLACLPAEEIGGLLCEATAHTYPTGQTILREGETAEAVCLLLEGSVSLSTGDGVCDLGTLGKGDIFGVSAVFPDAICPRARAESTVHVAFLSAGRVRQSAARYPQIDRILRTISEQYRKRVEEGDSFLKQW